MLTAAAVAIVLLGCHREVKQAEIFIGNGALPDAERLLLDKLQKRPQDDELRFELGRVYLLEHRVDDADAILLPLADVPKFAQRVAHEYRAAALEIATASPEIRASALGRVGMTAAKLDPSITRGADVVWENGQIIQETDRVGPPQIRSQVKSHRLAFALILLAACDARVRHAKTLMERGSYDAAEQLLIAERNEEASDPESRLLLGEIYLRKAQLAKAQTLFSPVIHKKEMAWSIA